MKKARLKVIAGEPLSYKLNLLKEVEKSVTFWAKFATALITILIIVSCITGLIFSQVIFSYLGIDFIKYAEVTDYVKLSIEYVQFSLIVVILIVALFTCYIYYAHMRKVYPSWKIVCIVVVLIFGTSAPLYTYLKASPIGITPLKTQIPDSDLNIVKSIKMGKQGVATIVYGKDKDMQKCASIITQTGEFIHFWILKDQSLLSVNKSQILSIKMLIEPYPSSNFFNRVLTAFGSGSEKSEIGDELSYIFSKEQIKWFIKRSELCGDIEVTNTTWLAEN